MKNKYNKKTSFAKQPSLTVRNYKDTVFRMLYHNKKELLDLYNAVNDTKYDDPEDLKVTTLENAIYLSMKNDISCIVDLSLNLYEHQSTVNPNMPLRDLLYVARLFEKIIQEERGDLYSRNQIRIPSPRFIVFYNGTENQPERKIMRLSESFYQKTNEINLELVVLQLNINPGFNTDLMNKCQTLYEYMQYVDKVRKYSKNIDFGSAVQKAVKECIKEGILENFLRANQAEVIQMSIFEYDEELHTQTLKREGKEELISNMLKKGLSPRQISELTNESVTFICEIENRNLLDVH